MSAREMRIFLLGNGLLEPIDVHFAEYVARLGGNHFDELWLLAALVSYFANRGDTAFSPDFVSGKRFLDVFGRVDAAPTPEFPTFEVERLRAETDAVGYPGELKPIVFDGELFYLHKFYEYENYVAEFILERIASTDASASAVETKLLSMLGDTENDGGTNWQKVAALFSLRNKFLVVTGGPGTGKTTTAAVMLALALERNPNAAIKLVAPTGRAAERLGEAIRFFKTENSETLPEKISAAMPEEAETIHRFLGLNSRRPRYGKHREAPVDLLLVDEASMVSLQLFARLFEALPDSCRIILLGDKDQLMAVENGDTLRAITDVGSLNSFTADSADFVSKSTGGSVKLPLARNSDDPREDISVHLLKNWRFGGGGGIAALALAVNSAADREDVEALMEIVERSDELDFVELTDESSLDMLLEKHCGGWIERYRSVLEGCEDPAEVLGVLSETRILCAVNEGVFGVDGLNSFLSGKLFGKPTGRSRFRHGEPILITRNDYRLGLMNGSVGVALEEDGVTRVWFEGESGGEMRSFNPSSLNEFKTAFAVSVHKSQGSEFGSVIVVLPPYGSEILSKELLYTAITRARKRCVLAATSEILGVCAVRRVQRAGGLRNKLLASLKKSGTASRFGDNGI